MNQNKTMEDDCNKIVHSLKKSKINFLAVDFDLTLICEHTGGRWVGGGQELAIKVRPLFKLLIPLALQNDIQVAIVTFSPQTGLIGEVLRHVFPEYASDILIRGEDKSWEYIGGGSTEGKQAHMASAAEELSSKSRIKITRGSTLLIDDDCNNIRAAFNNKVRAIRFDPADISSTISCLISLI
jgi:hypothetical protein